LSPKCISCNSGWFAWLVVYPPACAEALACEQFEQQVDRRPA
jgi:hypothetical protein